MIIKQAQKKTSKPRVTVGPIDKWLLVKKLIILTFKNRLQVGKDISLEKCLIMLKDSLLWYHVIYINKFKYSIQILNSLTQNQLIMRGAKFCKPSSQGLLESIKSSIIKY